MKRQHSRTRRLLVSAGLMALLAGCSDPASRRQITERVEGMHSTAVQLEKAEADRPKSLAWTLHALSEQNRHDAQNTMSNSRQVGEMVDDEFNRWKERQPAYRKEIREQLQGDCENVRRTAPQMAW